MGDVGAEEGTQTLLVAAEIKGGEAAVADGEFFRCWKTRSQERGLGGMRGCILGTGRTWM